MKSVNSLSGGKTSSYLAVHYPANYNIFTLVCIDDEKCKPKDAKFIQKINDKLEKSGSLKKYGEFIATAEDDKTLKVLLDLEQKIGKEIIWLRGKSFDELITYKKTLPFKLQRFCTQQMKMQVVGEWGVKIMNENVIDGVPQKIIDNVGIRYDEENREKKGDERELSVSIVIGETESGRKKWQKYNWGVVNYPLIENKITHYHVKSYWKEQEGIIFPDDSNCIGCFHKPVQQLKKNSVDNPEKFEWFAEKERNMKNKKIFWKRPSRYDNIKKLGLQMDFNFGTGSGCNGGFCTD